MLFSALRLVICGIIFVIGFCIVNALGFKQKKKWYIGLLILVIIFGIIISFFPLENAVLNFSSPQAAYYYNYTEKIQFIVSGTKSDLVVATRSSNTDLLIALPKTDTGWKISPGINIKPVKSYYSNDIAVEVYQYRNACDYYVSVNSFNPGAIDITDNRNSNFSATESRNTFNAAPHYCYYAHIENPNVDYKLTANGNEFLIGDIFS